MGENIRQYTYADKYNYKKAFLSNLENQSKINPDIEYCFEHCLSNEYGRDDLCRFTFEEFQDMIYGMLKKHSIGNTEKNVSIIKKYLDFCEEKAPENVKLTSKIINNRISDYGSINKWLTELIGGIDYSEFFISQNELLSITNNLEQFDYQDLSVYWLLFLGLRDEEVKTLEVANVNGNIIKTCYRDKIKIPDFVTNIIEKAKSQTHIVKRGRAGSIHEAKFKNTKFLVRSHKQDADMPVTSLRSKVVKLSEFLDKPKLNIINLNKSGMMFYGANLIEINAGKINTYQDLYNVSVKQLSG